jgi:hypothetical protein
VPTAKRLRADRKERAALGRKRAAGRSQQGAVALRVSRPLVAAPEDCELVAKQDDLELLLADAADKHAEKQEEEPVQQRHQHDAESEPSRPRSPDARPSRTEFLYPTAPEVAATGVVVAQSFRLLLGAPGRRAMRGVGVSWA